MEVFWDPQIKKEELHDGQMCIPAAAVCAAAHADVAFDDDEREQFSPCPPVGCFQVLM